MFAAASAVVMVSSIRLFQQSGCSGDNSSGCRRVKYAVSLGAIALALSMFEIVASNRGWLSLYPEAGLTFVLFALYVVGIAVITFGNGPATNVGNLYFATWIGFVLMLFLESKSWNAVMAHRKGGSEEEEAVEGGDDDKKVEDSPPEAPLEVSGEENT